MAKTMLIDATHPEETRVAVVDGKKLEEFDVEIAGRRPLKGNIYLAKVTRVEPSLQACFVEYGGNRHGFLAFSEIHPDYYRIPVADREALMRETQAALESEQDERPDEQRRGRRRRQEIAEAPETEAADNGSEARDSDADMTPGATSEPAEPTEAEIVPPLPEGMAEAAGDPTGEPTMALRARQDVLRDYPVETVPALAGAEDNREGGSASDQGAVEAASEGLAAAEAEDSGAATDADLPLAAHGELVEVAVPEEVFDTVGGSEPASNDDPEVDEENARRRRQRALRRYKIQEVIKRRQILLVQVTKEERGNKGAALTTYLSLAGRYCVLMPNTDRGGGISRRITSLNDRKRLKNIVDDLDVPEGMAVIVRTAGSERSKAEVKRDFEYLMRLWDEIRETTLKSTAPALIYEEASLIKRSIRDLYTREMGDIVVAGVEGYKQAKSFMRMLTPSHAKRVQLYRDLSIPLFQRYQVENQLAAIHNPVVHLRSGGYIVINQTEALVAIDVNSGRATKERNIEETALKTNVEAAEEVARQLRLRDLAGLIVIDFIDMEEGRNNSAVERRLKDALRNDRARIQIGRISSFGLLEMSRQRLHPSLQEASTDICPHCRGSGRIRSVDSTALHVLRLVEEEISKSFSPGVSVFAPTAVALYILNQKRSALAQLEMRRGVRIYINGDDSLTPPDYRLERIKQLAPGEELPPAPAPVPLPADAELDLEDDIVDEVEEEADEAPELEPGQEGEAASAPEGAEDDQGGRGRGRRRRRRRGRGSRFSADEFTESAERSVGEPDAASEQDEGEAEVARPAPAVAAEEGDASVGVTDEAEDEGEDAASPGEGDSGRRRRRRGRRGGRRRTRRGQEPESEGGETAQGDVGDGEAIAGVMESSEARGDDRRHDPAVEAAIAEGEQPPLPEDSEALPPQWRRPSAPAAQPASRSDTERPAESPSATSAAEESASGVTVIEVGGTPAGGAEGGDAADDQARRRGWWRRLIE